MDAICYICDKTSNNWSENLNIIKSKHSQKPITAFIKEFLADYKSHRHVRHKSNCICFDCLSKIYAYDWTCIKAKEQEKELQRMLLATEAKYEGKMFNSVDNNGFRKTDIGPVIELIDDDDYAENIVDDKSLAKIELEQQSVVKIEDASVLDVKPVPLPVPVLKPEPEPEPEPVTLPVPMSSIKQSLPLVKTVDPPKKSKPIIVRVVKRVPFLNSKPPISTSQINATAKPINAGEGPSKLTITPKLPATKNSPTKNLSQKKQKATPIRVCKYCDGKFPNEKILQNHMKLHSRASGYVTCHICFYQMNTNDKDSFKDHVKKHSKVPPKQCVLCDETNTGDFDLREHVQNQHPHIDPGLLCDFCGKTFNRSSGLIKHQKSHIDDRPEQCPYCPKAFKLKRSLKEHLDTHLNTEPAFACAFCDKRFRRKDHLRLHEKRHRGDTKRFKCTLCPAAFEFKHDFNLHLQRKHDAEMPHDKNRK